MRTTRFGSPLRRLATTTVAVGLLGAGVAPALADDSTELTLGGPSHITVAANPDGGAASPTEFEITVDNPAEKPEDGSHELYDYTVTFDTSGLSGVADVKVTEPPADRCETTGGRIVCDYFGAPPGGPSTFARLSLTVAPGSDVGESGKLRVTAETLDTSFEQATFTDYTARVTVGGADLLVKPLPQRHDAKPGDIWTPQLQFANGGSAHADGVSVVLRATHGLEFTERFGNCVYGESERTPATIAYCRVPGRVEPLRVYTVDPAVDVEVTNAARMDDFSFAVYEDPVEALRTITDEVTTFDTNDGPELKLREVPARRSLADPSPGNNSTSVTVMTENTADFALTGDTAEGAKGETATVEVTFTNHGPAWIAYLRMGGPVAVVDVRTPAGATVTAKPSRCRGVTADGDYRAEQLGAPRYFCRLPSHVLEDTEKSLEFRLRVDEVVEDAEGLVSFLTEGPGHGPLGFDPEKGNNHTAIVLNPHGDTGSDTGTDGGTGTGGAEGEDDNTAGSGGSEGTTGDSGGSGEGDGEADEVEGGLAMTGGSGLFLTAGAAALALAGGVTALFLARRRQSRDEDGTDGTAAA